MKRFIWTVACSLDNGLVLIMFSSETLIFGLQLFLSLSNHPFLPETCIQIFLKQLLYVDHIDRKSYILQYTTHGIN